MLFGRKQLITPEVIGSYIAMASAGMAIDEVKRLGTPSYTNMLAETMGKESIDDIIRQLCSVGSLKTAFELNGLFAYVARSRICASWIPERCYFRIIESMLSEERCYQHLVVGLNLPIGEILSTLRSRVSSYDISIRGEKDSFQVFSKLAHEFESKLGLSILSNAAISPQFTLLIGLTIGGFGAGINSVLDEMKKQYRLDERVAK